jgi:hypothetical protein
MSTATDSSSETQPDLLKSSDRVGHRVKRSSANLVWAIAGCLLLSASGGLRMVQDRRHQSEKSYRESCPINLDQLPETFGDDWKSVKGEDRKLDDQTMRITGGTAYKIRTYANDLTGVLVTILILFGPAEPVLPHTPQICYPSSGFAPDDPSTLRTIEFPIGTAKPGEATTARATFLAETYAKPNGRQMLREAVYHSFRLDGEWSPFVGQGRKFPRRNPGIFKVQIHRLVAERESVGPGDPIEQFLQKFLSELEVEIQAAASAGAKTVATR